MNLREELIQKMRIPSSRIDEINEAIFHPDQRVINDFLDVVTKYGAPDEINARAAEAGQLSSLEAQVKRTRPEYLEDLSWLRKQVENRSFIRISNFRRKILGGKADQIQFKGDTPVTLEISACQYFPWLMEIARRAVQIGAIPRSLCARADDEAAPVWPMPVETVAAEAELQIDQFGKLPLGTDAIVGPSMDVVHPDH